MATPSQIVAQERIRRAMRVEPQVVSRVVRAARAEGAPVEEAARRAAIAAGIEVEDRTPEQGQVIINNPPAQAAQKTNWLFWIAIAGGGYWLWKKSQDDQRMTELTQRREERQLLASLMPEPRQSLGSGHKRRKKQHSHSRGTRGRR